MMLLRIWGVVVVVVRRSLECGGGDDVLAVQYIGGGVGLVVERNSSAPCHCMHSTC